MINFFLFVTGLKSLPFLDCRKLFHFPKECPVFHKNMRKSVTFRPVFHSGNSPLFPLCLLRRRACFICSRFLKKFCATAYQQRPRGWQPPRGRGAGRRAAAFVTQLWCQALPSVSGAGTHLPQRELCESKPMKQFSRKTRAVKVHSAAFFLYLAVLLFRSSKGASIIPPPGGIPAPHTAGRRLRT